MRPEAAEAVDRAMVRPRLRRAALMLAGLVPAVLLLAFVVWPIALVVARSDGRYAELFGAEGALALLLRSLAVAGTSAVLVVAVGSLLAYAVTRVDSPGQRLAASAIRLPMLLPPFFPALGLILLFGNGGLVPRALGARLGVYGFLGIVFAQIFTFLPRAFLIMAEAFDKTASALEEAAESLGASGLTVARRVTLPLVWRDLVSSLLIVFALCLSDFGNPFLIGGDFRVLATEIYFRAVGGQDPSGAAAMGVALLAPCLLAYALSAHWIGRRAHPSWWSTGIGVGRRLPAVARRLFSAAAAGGAASVVGLYGGIALGSLVPLSATGRGVSFRHYAFVAGPEGAWPIMDSLLLAGLAAGIGAALAVGVGSVIARRRPPAGSIVEVLSLLPSALPGTVLGLGYLLAFAEPPLRLAGTIWILVASVVFWKLPLGVGTATRFLARVDPSLEEAARSLGAGRLRTFAGVSLPYLARAGCAAFADFFIDGIATVSAVILLVYPGFIPASVAILTLAREGDLGRACALGTILAALALGASLLRRRTVGRDAYG